ncbi:hypothetical protein V6Z12_A05G228400 [Gossypium hirsutum]
MKWELIHADIETTEISSCDKAYFFRAYILVGPNSLLPSHQHV